MASAVMSCEEIWGLWACHVKYMALAGETKTFLSGGLPDVMKPIGRRWPLWLFSVRSHRPSAEVRKIQNKEPRDTTLIVVTFLEVKQGHGVAFVCLSMFFLP